MKNEKQSFEEHQLDNAVKKIGEAGANIVSVAHLLRLKRLAYQTPQWHHTVLWAGFAFLIGMLIGAGLMAG